QVTHSGNRASACLRHEILYSLASVRVGLTGLFENEIDLSQTEPGEFDVELKIDQRLQLDGEDLLVPAGIQRELVVRENIGPPLCFGEMRQGQRGHALHAEKLGRLDSSVACDDLAITRDEHGIGEAEALDRGCDLLELFSGMGSRVARVR